MGVTAYGVAQPAPGSSAVPCSSSSLQYCQAADTILPTCCRFVVCQHLHIPAHVCISSDMTPRRLRQLADIIDAKFLNGSLSKVCSPTYAVQDSRLTPEEVGYYDKRSCSQATAGFEPATNTISFYKPSWHKQPSLSCPVQADGVYCTNRLQWLAHTLAHEQVHCIVHHACPQARASKAYTASHGHGPIFVSLNRHIFGHDTVRYKVGWGRLRPSLHVQPLQVTHSFPPHCSEDCSDHEQEQGSASSSRERF